MCVCVSFMQIFAGLLVNLPSIASWLAWLKYLSIPQYGLSVSSYAMKRTCQVGFAFICEIKDWLFKKIQGTHQHTITESVPPNHPSVQFAFACANGTFDGGRCIILQRSGLREGEGSPGDCRRARSQYCLAEPLKKASSQSFLLFKLKLSQLDSDG